jgi:lipopolysaccharide transport system permease protein
MGVFSFLFASNPVYKLNLIVGLFLWDFFAEATMAGLLSLQARSFLMTKTRVPSWILVVTSISNAVITLCAFSVVMATFLAAEGHAPSAQAFVAYLAYAAAMGAMVVGFSLAASVLFLRYRDLHQVWEVVLQAGFFVAPIIYPLDILPERFHFYLYVWPPTPVIEFSRMALVAGTMPTMRGHVYLACDAAICLIAGAAVFRWLSPRAAEYL